MSLRESLENRAFCWTSARELLETQSSLCANLLIWSLPQGKGRALGHHTKGGIAYANSSLQIESKTSVQWRQLEFSSLNRYCQRCNCPSCGKVLDHLLLCSWASGLYSTPRPARTETNSSQNLPLTGCAAAKPKRFYRSRCRSIDASMYQGRLLYYAISLPYRARRTGILYSLCIPSLGAQKARKQTEKDLREASLACVLYS